MAKENWKCPYPDCRQECSRRSNMIRHIKRRHDGLEEPVKEKAYDTNQARANKFVKSNGLSPLYRKKRPSKAFREEENDVVDTVYEVVKKTKVKVNKIKEIEAFFGQSDTGFPSSNSVSMSPVDLPVGFKMYTCGECFTAPIDPVKLSDFMRQGPKSFLPNHMCRQEDMKIKRQRAEKGIYLDFITTWDKLRSFSIRFLADMIHKWFGPHKDLSANVVEVDESATLGGELLPINLGTIGNDHWIHRALDDNEGNGSTTINEDELKIFLNLAKGTFALFRAKVKNEDKCMYAYIGPRWWRTFLSEVLSPL